MFPENVTSSLDHLARLGILDYDAAADIAGTAPRYYGKPSPYVSTLLDTPLDRATFSYNAQNSVLPPTILGMPTIPTLFKTALGLIGLYWGGKGVLYAGTKIRNFSFKNLFKWKKSTPAPTAPAKKSAISRIGDWFKNLKLKKVRP